MLSLYHYVHCPFCVRVRMALGFLKLEYESIVVPYDDEKTPIELAGKKMLPILKDKELVLNESLDIIKHLDRDDQLHFAIYEKNHEELDQLLSNLGSYIHSLVMPYWMYTPEFNEASREYFKKGKEVKRGPLMALMGKKEELLEQLRPYLLEVEAGITTYYKSDHLSIKDIMLASHLWGLFVLPEFQFTPKVYNYLMKVKKETRFDYHIDFYSPTKTRK